MTTTELLTLARKHLGGSMESSARLCLADAVKSNDKGDIAAARTRAVMSLRYSVGVFHKDYQRAAKQASPA